MTRPPEVQVARWVARVRDSRRYARSLENATYVTHGSRILIYSIFMQRLHCNLQCGCLKYAADSDSARVLRLWITN